MPSSYIPNSRQNEMLEKFKASLKTSNNAVNDDIKDLLGQIDTISGDDEIMSGLTALLSLPDQEFEILAPLYREEIEKSYNNDNTKLIILQSMNIKGITLEELREEYDQICEQINLLIGHLPATKLNFLKDVVGILYNSISEADGIAKQVVEIPISFCGEDAKLPYYSTIGAAAADVYSPAEYTLAPGQQMIIPLNFKFAIPNGYAVLIQPRSGLTSKTKIRVHLGLIDSDYRGPIGVMVENTDPPIRGIEPDENDNIVAGSIIYGQSYTIGKGERIAQIRLVQVPKMAFDLRDTLDETERGEGGFGHTGK